MQVIKHKLCLRHYYIKNELLRIVELQSQLMGDIAYHRVWQGVRGTGTGEHWIRLLNRQVARGVLIIHEDSTNCGIYHGT